MTSEQTTPSPTFTHLKISPAKTSLVLTRPYEDSKRVFKDYQEIVPFVMIAPCQRVVKKNGISSHNAFTHTTSTHTTPAHTSEAPRNHKAHQKISFIITSHNALHALEKTPRNLPIFCVGNYTKQELIKLGFEHVTQFETAKSLQKYLADSNGLNKNEHFLFLSGQKISVDFEQTIPNCRRIQVYTIEPIISHSKEIQNAFKSSDMVIFPVYSRHSFQNLNKLLTLNDVYLKKVIIIAMSEACIKNNNTSCYGDVVIAKKPNHQSMLHAVREYLNKQDFENG